MFTASKVKKTKTVTAIHLMINFFMLFKGAINVKLKLLFQFTLLPKYSTIFVLSNDRFSFKPMQKYLAPFLLLLCISGCHKKQTANPGTPTTTVALKYAHGFTVKKFDAGTLVEVTAPYQGATSGIQYFLLEKNKTVPAGMEGISVIPVPIDNIICTSTTHIPMLDYLEETDKLIGFPTLDYVSSEKMRERIDQGLVKELGMDKGMNLELIASLHASLVMGYSMTGDFGQFKKIAELGTPVVLNAEYLEKHPLGRAEWIKFVALFFKKEAQADSVFNAIEKDYLQTHELVSSVENKPSVMSGIVYGDAWFLPGGQNYAARLLKDAGCHYLWENDSTHGYLQLSFESVYNKAIDADLWIGVGSYPSRKELKDADNRYAKFKPFIQNQVYSYDGRQGAKGGNEFLELGYLRPDIILKDLVKIAHPDLLPDYTLYFHKKIE